MSTAYTQENLTGILIRVARQLDNWADESISGGWSTHQVKPQRRLAVAIRRSISSGNLEIVQETLDMEGRK